MTTNIQSSIGNLFHSLSFTGNPAIDTLLLSTAIPIILAYMNGMINLVKSVVGQIFDICCKYIKLRLKMKTVGNLVCNVNIDPDSDMYNFINETVFDPTVESDIDKGGLLSMFNSTESTGASLNDWYARKYEIDRTFNIHKNYNDGALINPQFKYGYDDLETKFFKYKTFMLRFTKKTTSISQSIKLDILTYKTVNTELHEVKKYVKILEDFMIDKFSISNMMYYTYNHNIAHSGMGNMLSKLFQNGYKNTTTGELKYGNSTTKLGSIIKSDGKKYANKDTVVNMKINNISDINRDYRLEIELYDSSKHCEIDSSVGFTKLYKKYVSSTVPKINHYGYFVKDNDIFMIHDNKSRWTINIISFGKRLTDDDIKQRIDYIIKLSISADTIKPTVGNNKKNVSIYKRVNGKWIGYALDRRSLNTIYLPDSTINDITYEVDKFLTDEKLFREFQIPYKKGLLFYGPPGTGKTSIVKALAYEYQMNIYMVNVNDSDINDDSIIDILNSLGGGRKILLFEDIDTAFADKEIIKHGAKLDISKHSSKQCDDEDTANEPEDKSLINQQILEKIVSNSIASAQPKQGKFLTYSGLLNALDGVLSNQHAVITIMTTNYKEKLGDAFIRPGRIDKMYELKECNDEQIFKMTRSLVSRKMKLMTEYIKNNRDSHHEKVSLDFKLALKKYTNEYLDVKIAEFASNLVDETGFSKIKPCQLQFYLVKYIDNIDSIFENYREIING